MMLKPFLALCLLCVCGAQDSRTIYQYLQDEHYTKLMELVLGAGLMGEFMNSNAIPITLFAPTDAAFEALPDSLLAQLQTNATLLTSVLQGHVCDETILNLFIRDGVVKTAQNGDELKFKSYANKVKTVNGARLGDDIILANGVVHQVDRVLLPLDNSISGLVAETDQRFRDLFGLLVLGQLFGTLSTGGPYTVFAPEDSAFENVDLTGLVSNRTAVAGVLLNHVVSGAFWSAGLTDGMTLDTLGQAPITITINSTGVFANNAAVIEADMGANNGLIHVIDGIL